MTQAEIIAKNKAILLKYLPEGAVEDIFDYLYNNKIHFKIVNDRKTKLGDYRWPQHHIRYHQITINGGLNPYAFLFVLLHEIAHHATYLNHQTSVHPHGPEWQAQYRILLRSHLGLGLFPPDVEQAIAQYCSSLPLKATAEQAVMNLLWHYDSNYNSSSQTLLKDLPIGTQFQTTDGRRFRSIEKRRTCYKCLSLDEDRLYLVHGDAKVSTME